MIVFDKKRVLLLYQLISQEIGENAAMRDFDALNSAMASIYETDAHGKDLHPTIEQKAACLGYHLITSRPFANGNTRTGMYVLLTMLEANGIHSSADNADVSRTGKAVSDGTMTYNDLLEWVYRHEQFD